MILLAAHGHNAAEIVQKSTDSGRDTGRIWIGTDAWTGWPEIEQTGTEALVMGLTPATNDDAPENTEYINKFNEWYDETIVPQVIQEYLQEAGLPVTTENIVAIPQGVVLRTRFWRAILRGFRLVPAA